MTKAELVNEIKEQVGCTKTVAEEMLKALTSTITKTLKTEGSLRLDGIGTFSVVERAARKGRNPRTGQEISIPAAKALKFAPAKSIKEDLN